MNDEQQPNDHLEPSEDDAPEIVDAEALLSQDEIDIEETNFLDEPEESSEHLEEPEDELELIEEETSTSVLMDAQDFDIESALAAVASLHELSRPTDDVEDEEVLDDEAEPIIEPFIRTREQTHEESQIAPETIYETDFPIPPLSVLYRGQLGSVIPALLLIGVGTFLTFWIPSQTDGVNPLILVGLFVACIGITLIAHWLSSGRWSVGSFLIGSLLVLCGGTMSFLFLSDTISFINGYPLLLTAMGTSFVITDLLTTNHRRLWLLGLMLAIAGLAGFIVTNGILAPSILSILTLLWIPLVVIIVIAIIASLLGRRRSTDANRH